MAIDRSKESRTGRGYKQIRGSLFAMRNRKWPAIKCLSHARQLAITEYWCTGVCNLWAARIVGKLGQQKAAKSVSRCAPASDKGMETRTERLAYAESMVKRRAHGERMLLKRLQNNRQRTIATRALVEQKRAVAVQRKRRNSIP